MFIVIAQYPAYDEVVKLLKQLSHPEQVLAVCIDMWKEYKTAIESVLPQAIVVIDAFHVIQASTRALGDVRKSVQKALTEEQRIALKQDKNLFVEPIEDLTPDQKERLKQWEETSPQLAQAISLHQKSLYRCSDLEEALDLFGGVGKRSIELFPRTIPRTTPNDL